MDRQRATRQAMIEAQDAADEAKINALEGVDDGLDIVPERWDAGHAAKRMIEAFRTLRALPDKDRPRGFGSAMPAYTYDWEDRLAQASLPMAEQLERAAEQNRSVHRPTATEIAEMFTMLGHLVAFSAAYREFGQALSFWAAAKACGRSTRGVARALKTPKSSYARSLEQALTRYADYLNRRSVATW